MDQFVAALYLVVAAATGATAHFADPVRPRPRGWPEVVACCWVGLAWPVLALGLLANLLLAPLGSTPSVPSLPPPPRRAWSGTPPSRDLTRRIATARVARAHARSLVGQTIVITPDQAWMGLEGLDGRDGRDGRAAKRLAEPVCPGLIKP